MFLNIFSKLYGFFPNKITNTIKEMNTLPQTLYIMI